MQINPRVYSQVTKQAADAAVKEVSAKQLILLLPGKISFKVMVILIHAHFVNLSQAHMQKKEEGANVE